MSDHGKDRIDPLRGLERRLAERDERTRRAHVAAAEVTGLPAAERPEFVRTHPDCLEPEFIELMIAMARERRGPAPEESVAYAHLAATAAETAHAAGVEVDDARPLAFAELGNAHRICGDLRRAGIAFHLARERVRYASDPLVRAEVDSLEASYLTRRCDFSGAERLLLRAERIQRACGSPNGIGRLRIKRGTAAGRSGDTQRAIKLLTSGLNLIDPDIEPRLLLASVHNLSTYLIDADKPDAALSLLWQHREAYQLLGSDADRARLGWLEGKAAARAGLLGLAETTLERTHERFAALSRPYETALVLLDLTEVYAERTKWVEVEAAAAYTLALCHACGLGTEGLAAAALLHENASRLHETGDRIAKLVATLRHHLERDVNFSQAQTER